VQNLGVVRTLAGPGVPVHPVVKADAYGHGALPVTRALAAAGADGFCVATLDEALALREGGIDRPILVLYPIPPALAPVAAAAGIAISAGDPELLRAVLRAVAEASGGPALAIELEVETGLGRGGFLPEALAGALKVIQAGDRVRVSGLWTHMQAPEDPDRARAQADRFAAAADLATATGLHVPRHQAASGSLVLGDIASLDAVRPGLATYGLLPDELRRRGAADPPVRGIAAGLRPVLRLCARPVRVALLPAGWGVSYGPSFVTARPSRIATLPIGYGDGWSGALSNRAVARGRGQRVPLVGNVAMDAVMADVTDVPGPPVTAEDEFVLIGAQGDDQVTVAELAAARGTNSWEVVTGLSDRLPRVYHAASVPQAVRTLAGNAGPASGVGRSS